MGESSDDSKLKPSFKLINKKVTFGILGVIVAILVCSSIYIFCNRYNVEKKVFSLSDNSTLIFINEETYILTYEVMDREIIVTGSYNISYGDEVNENVLYEYEQYIEELKTDEYLLGFLELQNNKLYIDNIENNGGTVNTYYILVAYYENGVLNFEGYNVDTGIKVKFSELQSEYSNYIELFSKYIS